MAVYLIPELLKKGYSVVGVSLDDAVSNCENLTYIKADAKDFAFLEALLAKGFDAVVDNSKILSLCGMKQEELMPLKEGLMRELKNIFVGDIEGHQGINERMDQYLESIGRA